MYQVVNIDSNIDTLIRLGLGDKKLLTYYKKVMKDPSSIGWDAQSKKFLLKMFTVFRDVIFDNDQVYSKVRANMVAGSHEKFNSWTKPIDRPIRESTIPSKKIDYLLRLGWDDVKYLTMNRGIIQDPKTALGDPFKREKFVNLFIKMRNMVLLDPFIFERAKKMLRGRRLTFSEHSQRVNNGEKEIT